MAKKDIDQPLRAKAVRRSSRRWLTFAAPVLISAALLVGVFALFWIAVVDDPDGGRAVAVAEIQDAAPTATGSVTHSPMTDTAPAAEGAPPQQLAALPAVPSELGTAQGLVETSALGPLPRVSADGRRPRDVYAGTMPPVPSGARRVAIVIGGLGLSQTGTLEAIETLPPGVTFAFAPTGSSLQRWADRARADGHELLVQIPLEPNGYPQESPGEHTLLVSGGGTRNRDNLHWALGRMTAYAGVMNYMGARFATDTSVLGPFLGEIAERGLYYLDDGSASGSRVSEVADALKVPVVSADVMLDASRDASDIEAALGRLEAIAGEQGIAVGVASAFPVSVDTITRWAKEAAARGVVIVPASAALKL